MTVKKDNRGALANEDCPVYRIRVMSELSDGRIMVSINSEPWKISREQYKKLETLMQEW